MLTISGLKRFYYIPGMTDMRCGYNRLLQIVKQTTHHDPYNGDVFVFMSKDRRKVEKPKDRDRDEEREGFDGTNCEKASDPSELPAEETTSPCPEKEERPNRQGMNYDTMHASRRILHKSDLSKLPDGDTFLSGAKAVDGRRHANL